MFNLMNPEIRKQIIAESKSSENVERKSLSFGQYEVYRDRILPQVKKYLEGFYSEETIKETPIVASVNLARRIVNKEASLYCKAPTRKWSGMTDAQIKLIEQIYKDMKIDKLMQKLNRNFKLQDQAHAYITPKKGKFKGNSLLSHQFDVIPSSADPEDGEVYVINGFDRVTAGEKVTDSGDSMNEMIADEDDYQAARAAMAVWSPIFNFVMNENAAIVSGEDVKNPIGMLPFVDIFDSKDGEYWVRCGSALTDFTIQFNAGLTDLGNIVRMQGFGQAYFKGSPTQKMQNLVVGANRVLHLPFDENANQQSEFGYATPNPDLAGSLSYLEGLLSSFLTSRGVNPKIVNTKGEATSFASGLERLLSMMEQFEATEEDASMFVDAEVKVLKIIIAYVEVYGGSNVLPDYPKMIFSKDASVDVEYARPTSIQTESEKLANIKTRRELNLITLLEAIMQDRGIAEEEAKKVLAIIDQEKKDNTEQAQNPADQQTQQNDAVTA